MLASAQKANIHTAFTRYACFGEETGTFPGTILETSSASTLLGFEVRQSFLICAM